MVRLVFRTAAGEGCRVCVRFDHRAPEGGSPSVPADEAACFHMQEMNFTHSDGMFDWFAAELCVTERPLFYFFEIAQGQEHCYFGLSGYKGDLPAQDLFRIIPGFHTPGWAKGAVCYQIMVDRFRNGDLSNDVQEGEYIYLGKPVHAHQSWEQLPGEEDYRDFYGGDLQGVLNKLDYLQGLGVDVVYFNPLFASLSSHKYDTADYRRIDPHFGTNELFIYLVGEMHRRGMRVILDGVFNHCGAANYWFVGAYAFKESPYADYFLFRDTSVEAWPGNESYVKWWENKTLPKLNYRSQKLRTEILNIARMWVSEPYNADGWRLDVAADLGMSPEENHGFWHVFREAVRQVRPDALIVAEHYGDPAPWLWGGEWDTVMNYDAFFEPVSWFFTGMDKHSDRYEEGLFGNGPAFKDMLSHAQTALPGPSVSCAMNQLSNHDHSRFLTRTGHKSGRLGPLAAAAAGEGIDKAAFRAAALFQMTWTGMPTLYYGDEAGLCGFTDPDNRRTFPWGYEDEELTAFYRELIRIRHEHPALMHGSVRILGAGPGWFAFGRFTDGQQVIAVVTVRAEGALRQEESEEAGGAQSVDEPAGLSQDSEKPAGRTLRIPVWQTGADRNAAFTRIMLSDRHSFSTEECEMYAEDGILRIVMPAEGGVILASKG